MIHVAEVVQCPTLSNAVAVLLANLEMAAAADHGLLELAHDFQGVAEVAGGLGLPQSVGHCPRQSEVVLVILHGFDIVSHVEVGIPELAVDGRQCPEINEKEDLVPTSKETSWLGF